MISHFVECTRDGGGRVRFAVDELATIWEGKVGKGENARKTLTIITRNNSTVIVVDETFETLFDKIAQCGAIRTVIKESSVPLE